jgi:hypothetical protein
MPWKPYPSEAQLWLDLSQEYPDERKEPEERSPAGEDQPEPKRSLCFTCRERSSGNDYAGPHSAYCGDCQPRHSGPSPHGKECLCSRCGEMFTSPSAFDLHQSGGSCLPMNATRRSGQPLFAP